ncbi:hypothetical protein EYF80_066796 [Liparis tanakae]|uniref:Uncharacterized protein n=1 Tax=Liparis tanakae TaxID=230148 RepID=A0A4Z2E2V6_9TELE|nr:hypothetical protein EYF80_066796 [Liparis tanakae]
MTSFIPADDLVEQRLEQPRLVGDGVLADVDVGLLQRLLDGGQDLLAVRCRRDRQEVNSTSTSNVNPDL